MSNLIKLTLSVSEVNVILNNLECLREYKDYINEDLKDNRSKYIVKHYTWRFFYDFKWSEFTHEKLKFTNNLLYVDTYIGTGACVNSSMSLLEVYWLTRRNVLVKDKPLEILADCNTYHGLTTLLAIDITNKDLTKL
jgi:hypothetical protein